MTEILRPVSPESSLGSAPDTPTSGMVSPLKPHGALDADFMQALREMQLRAGAPARQGLPDLRETRGENADTSATPS